MDNRRAPPLYGIVDAQRQGIERGYLEGEYRERRGKYAEYG